MLSKEEINILFKYEREMSNAIHNDFVRASNLNEIIDVYNRHYKDTIKKNTTCGGCILNMLKRIGNEYFKCKSLEQINGSKEELVPEVEDFELLEDNEIIVDKPKTKTNGSKGKKGKG